MEGGEGQASQMRHASPEAIHLHIDYADTLCAGEKALNLR